MSSGKINSTELAAALINQKNDLVSGILHAQEAINGSLTLLILTDQGEIIAARDRVGRLPVLIGKNGQGHCVSFESFAYHTALVGVADGVGDAGVWDAGYIVHIRQRTNSDMDLLARRTIQELEGDEGQKHLEEYADPSSRRENGNMHNGEEFFRQTNTIFRRNTGCISRKIGAVWWEKEAGTPAPTA